MARGHAGDIELWGYPIEHWFVERLQITMTDPVSYFAFQELGTNALPFLIGILEHRPSFVAEAADQARINYSPDPKRFDPGGNPEIPAGLKFLDFAGSAQKINERRWGAARLIGELGTNGASTIPTLMKIWNDPNEDLGVRFTVLKALAAMDDQVAGYLPDLEIAAKSTNANMRDIGILLISHCGAKGRAAIPLLRDFVAHGGPTLAGKAAEALWKVDRQTNVALQVFSELLANSDLKSLATIYLAELGQAARPVIPILLTSLEGTNRSWRGGAEALIRVIDPAVLAPINAQIKSNSAANISNLIADLKSDTPANVTNFLAAFPGQTLV